MSDFGVKREDLIGKGNSAYAEPPYGERWPIVIDHLNSSEAVDNIYAEIFIQTLNDGEGTYLYCVAVPLYDRTGLRAGAVEVIRIICLSHFSPQRQ